MFYFLSTELFNNYYKDTNYMDWELHYTQMK